MSSHLNGGLHVGRGVAAMGDHLGECGASIPALIRSVCGRSGGSARRG